MNYRTDPLARELLLPLQLFESDSKSRRIYRLTETRMICGLARQHRTLARVRGRRSRGFTLLELVLVIAVGMILAAMAVPVIWNTMRIYSMRSAISSLTGAISSSRYQAIFHGCKSQVVITKATYSYQVQSEAPAFGGQACAAAFTNVGGVVPLMGRGVALSADITLTFSPGGSVISNPVASPITLTLSYPGFVATVPTETITVSNYGNITVAP
jgi:prepilin-type N-terminal cleavage/methylation domain-containing protein